MYTSYLKVISQSSEKCKFQLTYLIIKLQPYVAKNFLSSDDAK